MTFAAAFTALATPAALSAQTPPDGAELVRLMHDRYVAKWYTTLTFTQATQRRTAADTMVHETWYEAMKLPGRLRIDVGTPDGVSGPKTADAIKAFERGTGMNETGTINPRLLAVLGSQPV